MADDFTFDDDEREDWGDEAEAALLAAGAATRGRISKKLTGKTLPARARALWRQGWWEAEVDGTVNPAFSSIGAQAANRVDDEFGLGLDDVLKAAAIGGIVGSTLQLLAGYGQHVRDRVLTLHKEAVGEGWDPDRLSSELGLDGDGGPLSDALLASMGRSAAANIAEGSAVATLNASDRSGQKTWRTVGDERVRKAHADADGQTVGLDEDFDIDGYPAAHPGDERLPDDLAINCRCALEYAVEPAEEEDGEAFAFNPDQERDDQGRWSPSGDRAATALDEALGPTAPNVAGAAREAGAPRPTFPQPSDDPLAHPSPEFADLPVMEIAAAGDFPYEDRDPMLAAIWKARGFDGPPTVASADEFDKVRGDSTVLYRGIRAPVNGIHEQAEERAEQFRTGEAFPGRGGYGAGTYATTDSQGAEAYTRGVPGEPLQPRGDGAVLKMALRDDARVATLREMYDAQDRWREAWKERLAPLDNDRRAELWKQIRLEERIVQDPGRLAAVLGYQAIRVQDVSPGKDRQEDYYTIQDRTALVVEAARQPPAAVFAYNPDQERDEQGRWAPSGSEAANALDSLGAPEVPTADVAEVRDNIDQGTERPPAAGVEPSDPAFADLPLDAMAVPSGWTRGDSALTAIWDARGFHGKPTVVPTAEFNRLAEQAESTGGGTVAYRGIAPDINGPNPAPESVAQARAWAHQFRYGDRQYAGFGGPAGNGTYAATNRSTADQYAGPGGEVVRMIVPADARTVSAADMATRQDEWKASWDKRIATADPAATADLEAQRRRESAVTSNVGRYAAALGYQAVTQPAIGDHQFINIQDRSMLVVEAGPPPNTATATRPVHLAFNPDQERDEKGQWAPSGDRAAELLDQMKRPDLALRPLLAEVLADALAEAEAEERSYLPTPPPLPAVEPSDAFAGLPVDQLVALGHSGQSGDPALAAIWTARGFDGKPTVVSPEEFDAVRGDSPVLYRGLEPRGGGRALAERYAEQFRTGDEPFAGFGIWGNGTHAATAREIADGHAIGWGGQEGVVMRLALKPDARVIDYDALLDEHVKWGAQWMQRFRDEPDRSRKIALSQQRIKEEKIAENPGRFAAALGYQAIRKPQGEGGFEEYIIQDRSAVIVDAANQPPAPVVGFAFNPDQERDERGRWAPSGTKADEALGPVETAGALDAYSGGEEKAAIQSATAADSLAAHLGPDGKFTAERTALHEQILAKTLAGVPSVEGRTSYMMGGGPAAGKSSILGNEALGLPQRGEAVFIDADAMKAALPEYQQMVAAKEPTAAAWVHEESSYLSKQGLARAVADKQPVVFDGTGDSSYESLSAKVEQLRDNGGRVVAHYATVDPQVALDRMRARGEQTGRVVPESVVLGTYESVSRVLPQAMEKGLFDEVTLWSTEGPSPTKVAEAKAGELVVHDEAAWEKFKGYGNPATFAYNPNQERDERGRWVPSGDKADGTLFGVETAGALDDFQGASRGAIQRATRPDSIAAHTGPDGKFTPERAALHERLLEEALAGVAPQEHPVSYLMGGGIAGGKSSVVNNPDLGIPQGTEAVQLNFDNFKEGLPEYRQMIDAGDRRAAAYVHAESAMLCDEAYRRAAANGQPVVIDGTNDGSLEVLEEKIDTLRAKGGTVEAHYVTIDPEVAVERALARAEKIGRYIPPTVVRKTHEGVAEVVPEAMEAGLFDKVTVWSTRDRQPVKLAEAKGSEMVVHDQAGWDQFKAIAQ